MSYNFFGWEKAAAVHAGVFGHIAGGLLSAKARDGGQKHQG